MISAKRFPFSNSIFQKCRTNKMITLYCCVFYMETKLFLRTLSDLLFQNKGIDKNILCVYTPTNKFNRSQPIASDILFNLLIFVRSVNWFIKFLFTRISLQRSATVLFLSLSSFFIFSTILFFIFMCLFGRFLHCSRVCSGQIYIKTYFFVRCLTGFVRVQNTTKKA